MQSGRGAWPPGRIGAGVRHSRKLESCPSPSSIPSRRQHRNVARGQRRWHRHVLRGKFRLEDVASRYRARSRVMTGEEAKADWTSYANAHSPGVGGGSLQEWPFVKLEAFSGKVDSGFPQKMRPLKARARFRFNLIETRSSCGVSAKVIPSPRAIRLRRSAWHSVVSRRLRRGHHSRVQVG